MYVGDLQFNKRTGVLTRVLVCAMSALAASPCIAVQLAYEAFAIGNGAEQYVPGPLVGQPNAPIAPLSFFEGSWVGPLESSGHIVRNSVIVGTDLLAVGGSVGSAPNARVARRFASPWADGTVGTYYVSWITNFGSLQEGGPDASVGYRATEFWSPLQNPAFQGAAPIGYVGYNQFSGANGLRLTLSFGPRQEIAQNAPSSFNEDGVPHFLVLKFELSASAAAVGPGDTVSLFIDPPIGWPGTNISEPALADATIGGLDLAIGAMSATSIFGGSGTFPEFDEIRVGTTFADVLPSANLSIDVPCVGDFSDACYSVIEDHFLTFVQGPEQGDIANSNGKQGGDGQVDLGDFHLWKTNRAETGAGTWSGISVPEPVHGTSVMLGVIVLCGKYRRSYSATGVR